MMRCVLPGLPSTGDEDERGRAGRVLADGLERGLVHAQHARAVVPPGVARYVHLYQY